MSFHFIFKWNAFRLKKMSPSWRTIKEIIEPYKDEVNLEGFLDIENELTSELYKKEERHIRKDTLYQLIKVLKDIVSQLKEKHNIEDSLFVFQNPLGTKILPRFVGCSFNVNFKAATKCLQIPGFINGFVMIGFLPLE